MNFVSPKLSGISPSITLAVGNAPKQPAVKQICNRIISVEDLHRAARSGEFLPH